MSISRYQIIFIIHLLVACTSQALAADVSGKLAAGIIPVLEQSGQVLVSIALQAPTDKATDRAAHNRAVATRQQAVLDDLHTDDYEIMHRFQSVAGLTLRVTDSAVLDQLARHPLVLRIDLETGGRGALNQSRPWVNADQAQASGYSGAGRTVVVMDTGIDTNHPDLISGIVQEACRCLTGVNCCPLGGSSSDGPGSAEDDNGHGTHVSGIITSDGTVAPLGIAPQANIVAVKMMDSTNSFCCASEITAALDWVLNNRPDVDAINMSLGTFAEFDGDCDNQTAWTINMAAAVNALRAVGVLSVAASLNSGNASGMSVPACLSGALAVGASLDNADTVASFSNSSSSLDLLAPGQSITSASNFGGSVTFSGTSMASPHVVAAAALIRQQSPSATVDQVDAWLRESPVMITDARNGITRPRLDITAALAVDGDGDGIAANLDNCTEVANSAQTDTDGDALGNACDPDLDQNCLVNFGDLPIMQSVFFSPDANADFTGDGLVNFLDLVVMADLFFLQPGPGASPNLCNP